MSTVKILVNDGIHADGQLLLSEAGYEVITEKVEQDKLPNELPDYDAIVVRSATKVRKDLIDVCPNLKVIARGGVGLDNIDVDYAKSKGIEVINTPAASSQSVAELVFGHLFNLTRSLHASNREMPTKGQSQFKDLKKAYSKGAQLGGKTIGVIGLGRIGREVARIGIGMGMRVIAVDPYIDGAQIDLRFAGYPDVKLNMYLETVRLERMLPEADFISLHIPHTGSPLLGAAEIAMMKDGVYIVNASRGGTLDEDALLAALESGKVAGAGLDVFVGEPVPRKDLLNHSKISLSPHIGASTMEAQANIGRELAEKIMHHFSVQ